MTVPIGSQWDMIFEGKTAYIVYADNAERARLEITTVLAGMVGYTNDYSAWLRDGEPVRRMGTHEIWRRR
jgi:hypothetical protein